MPADGIAQFVGNASQIGLLVVVLVAASALAFDARREMAVFLRTRVRAYGPSSSRPTSITAAAAVAGLVAGSLGGVVRDDRAPGWTARRRDADRRRPGGAVPRVRRGVTAAVASVMRGVAATAGVTLAGCSGWPFSAGSPRSAGGCPPTWPTP